MPNTIKCVVGGCGNESGGGINIHRFPKDPKQKMNWTRFVKMTTPKFVEIKSCGICSEHFSDDCFDQAFKLKQEFGLLSEKKLRLGPPLLPNAVPTIVSRPSTSSADSGSSSNFYLSPEAQQLAPSGKKRRLASEKRAKKKFVDELLGEPLTKPQPVKKKLNIQKNTPQESMHTESSLTTEEVIMASCIPFESEIVMPVTDENVEESSLTNLPVTIAPFYSPSLPLEPDLESSSTSMTVPVHVPASLPHTPQHVETSSTTKKDVPTKHKDDDVVIVGEPLLERDNVTGEPALVNLDHGYATASENSDESEKNLRGSTSLDKSHEGHSESSNNKDYLRTGPQKIVNERKFIVTESALDELMSALRCPKCSSPPTVINKSDPIGTLLKISASCQNGHKIIDWNSQPVVSEMPLLDILCCAALLFAANTFNQICNFMGFLNVSFVGKKLFSSLQTKHLCSVVNTMWTGEKSEHYEELQNDSQVVLCGDSSRDIPGFCTYTLLDENSGKVVNFESKQIADKCSVNSLEREEFIECLDQVLKKGIRVKAVATDQHAGIEEVMRERYKIRSVKHDLHMYHLSKRLSKKVNESAKLTGNSELAFLAPNIKNHLYWAAATCGGDPKILQEKWTSVIDLVPKVKMQESGGNILACAPVAPEGDNVWIRISSESCEELRSIIYDPQLLYDVGLLKEFYHSDGIAKYQSVLRKYCPKREKLTYQSLLARTKLAALEHNANTESAPKQRRKTKGRFKTASNGEVIIVSKEKWKWMENSLFAGRRFSHVYDMLIEAVSRTLHQPLPPEVFSS